MSDDARDDQPSGTNLPPEPKPRIAPRLGLKAQAQFLSHLADRAKMSDGADAAETFTLLTPLDIERLRDCADTLDWLYMERVDRRVKSKWSGK